MRIALERTTVAALLLALLLVMTLLLGGGARDDIASLAILRPVTVLLFAASLFLLPRRDFVANRALIFLALAMPLLALVQLIPLPPAVWHALPGRDLIWHLEDVAGTGHGWRPLSLVPFRTENSFWACFGPLAVLLLALAASRRHDLKFVAAIGAAIVISGVFGVLQLISGHGDTFYFYKVTNVDAGVGLFANRNHQAMLLAIAFPIAAAVARLAEKLSGLEVLGRIFAIALGLLMIPFLVATGSRAGLGLGVLAIALAVWVYGPRRRRAKAGEPFWRQYLWMLVIVVGVALLVAAVFVVSSSPLARIFASAPLEDRRFEVWGSIWSAAWQYFPVGSGLGSFVEVYKVVELDRNLTPFYLNHAHNDWLELLLTGGLPGVAIAVAAVFLFFRMGIPRCFVTTGLDRTDVVVARLGATIIIILAAGSIYDYPLRVPSLSALAAISAVWALGRRGG